MRLLDGVVRPYAWGSHTAIAALRGLPVPAPGPEAELWLGAHPGDPAAIVEDGQRHSLLEVIDADPRAELGDAVLDEFGAQLPYLLKLLAAAQPLSLQAHPSLAQAQSGFARENREGVPLDSPVRNYRDANHKPELIVALTDFSALAGFRATAGTLALLSALNVAQLSPYVTMLAAQPDQRGVQRLFTSWITLAGDPLATLTAAVLAGCEKYPETGEFAREARMVRQLAAAHPHDPGVLGALLLNLVMLRPGEGLYLPAGNMHAYLHGFGVEIMANSDNVLRGGLTPKHVDVAELSRVLDFAPRAAPVLRPRAVPGGFARYATPSREFALWTTRLAAAHSAELTVAGPRVAISVAGTATLRAGEDVLVLPPGAAAWLPASDPALTVHATAGEAHVFVASPG